MKPALLPEYIPAKQAALEVGLPYSTLRSAHFAGELPALRYPENSRRQSWYFKRADLLEFLERHTRRGKQRSSSGSLRAQGRKKSGGVTVDAA